jgi:predicted metal-dependent hydrolase
MVVGCERKALYRNILSVRAQKSVRGYCSTHKALAIATPQNKADAAFADYIRERER